MPFNCSYLSLNNLQNYSKTNNSVISQSLADHIPPVVYEWDQVFNFRKKGASRPLFIALNGESSSGGQSLWLLLLL